MHTNDWVMKGSGGECMHGTTHSPDGEPKGVVLLAHGFKGYKDYGMFPWLAEQFAALGYRAHRFNFSHSGMLGSDGPFERPDLFKLATWNTQVEDLRILYGSFAQDNLPTYLFGHSRGGVACLLAVGRGEFDVAGVMSLSAPSACNYLTTEAQETLLEVGCIESPSSRTDQMLHVGLPFLQEQRDDPASHDLLALAESIESPVLILHGEDDPTVDVSCAQEIAGAVKDATFVCVKGGNHVFNTPNPFPVDGTPSLQLKTVWDAIEKWL